MVVGGFFFHFWIHSFSSTLRTKSIVNSTQAFDSNNNKKYHVFPAMIVFSISVIPFAPLSSFSLCLFICVHINIYIYSASFSHIFCSPARNGSCEQKRRPCVSSFIMCNCAAFCGIVLSILQINIVHKRTNNLLNTTNVMSGVQFAGSMK